MADELDLQKLTISSPSISVNDTKETGCDVVNEEECNPINALLSFDVKTIRAHALLKPCGILIVGHDRRTRRKIVELLDASINIKSACELILDKDNDTSVDQLIKKQRRQSGILCFDDVDYPDESIGIILKALFPKTISTNQLVIGLASSEQNVPPSLRRAGKFEIVHQVHSSSVQIRKQIWTYIVSYLRNKTERDNGQIVDQSSDIERIATELAQVSPSYHINDFSKVMHEYLSENKHNEIVQQPKSLDGIQERFHQIMKTHQPLQQQQFNTDLPFISSSSEIPSSPSSTHNSSSGSGSSSSSKSNEDWGKHVGFEHVKQQLNKFIKWPIIHSKTYSRLAIKPNKGILIHGKSGSGKSLLMKSFIDHQLHHANYFYLNGNDIFNKYLGESEKRLRTLFSKARLLSPCVIIIDDMDIICHKRDLLQSSASESSGIEKRLNATLLTELDGVQNNNNVFVIGCVKDLDNVDHAVYRPGRLDVILNLNNPSKSDVRAVIDSALTNIPILEEERSVLIDKLVDVLYKKSPADIQLICKEAVLLALEEDPSCEGITKRHVGRALSQFGLFIT